VSVIEAQRTQIALDSADQPPARNWIPWLVGCACLAAFALIQLHVERLAHTVWVEAPGSTTPHRQIEWVSIRYHLVADMARFIALLLAGVALVRRGHRRLFALPILVYVFAPVIFGWRDGMCEFARRTPAAIGQGWPLAGLTDCASGAAAGFGPALLELALVLAPIACLALIVKRPHAQNDPDRVAGESSVSSWRFEIAGLAFAGFTLWALMWSWTTAGSIPGPWWTVTMDCLPLLVFGTMLATVRMPWVLVLVTITVGLLAAQLGLPNWSGWQSVSQSLYAWPYLLIGVIAAAWRPIARATAHLERRHLMALIVLNVLNLADAALTRFALTSEQAIESNPVVRAIGLPTKLVVVGGLSVLLYRLRPRVLPWIVLLLSAVIVWHAAGFFASLGLET